MFNSRFLLLKLQWVIREVLIKCQKWFAFAVVCRFVLLHAVVADKKETIAIFLNQLPV